MNQTPYYISKNQENLNSKGFLTGLNIALLILVIIDAIWVTVSLNLDNYIAPALIMLFASPSIFYHAFPALRKVALFRLIAHTVSSINLGLLVMGIFTFIMADDEGYGKLIILILILILLLPTAILALSLILLLNQVTKQRSFDRGNQYYMVQIVPQHGVHEAHKINMI